MRIMGQLIIVCALCGSSAAFAGPVVSPGGKPGAAQSWTASGTQVTLTLAKGYDAKAVADAIGKALKGATAAVNGDKVVITGMAQDQLLPALEKIEVAEAQDDVDQMLSSLQNQGGGEDGSGSSIRATNLTDFSEVMGKKEEQIAAKVVEVKRAQFPLVFVKVKLAQLPKGVTIEGVKVGATITVVPRVKSKNGVVDPSDAPSKLNLGAWYAQPGDTVMLRLEPKAKDHVWVAAAFDRRAK
jgi:hypothetical protein